MARIVKIRALWLAAVLALCAVTAQAQFKNGNQTIVLDLPEHSQRAVVAQRIGLTDITITYHRPLVEGRKIWGNVVPYGEVWRAGANENTTIEFTDPVTVEGKPLAKGRYGLHVIPTENTWTIIFSNDSTAWGSFTYNQKDDALRVVVKAQPSDMQEALSYEFDPVLADAATVKLRWEKVAVPFKVSVDVGQIAVASIRRQLRGLAQYTWMSWDDAAVYLLESNLAFDEALRYANQSIQAEERFDNLITKSRVLEAMKKPSEAAQAKQRAMEIGDALQIHTYGRQLQALGQPEQAFEIFQANAKKHPDRWFVHSGLARVYAARSDFASAAKEMRLALNGAPDPQKANVQKLIQRLEAKQDINP